MLTPQYLRLDHYSTRGPIFSSPADQIFWGNLFPWTKIFTGLKFLWQVSNSGRPHPFKNGEGGRVGTCYEGFLRRFPAEIPESQCDPGLQYPYLPQHLFLIEKLRVEWGSTNTSWHIDAQSILPHAENIWIRCYEAKVEQNKKAGSCRESNPGHLWLEPPVLCHWATTAGQLGSNRSKLLGNSSLILRGKGVYPRHSFYPYCAWVIWNKAAACTPTQKLCPGTLSISMGFLSNKKKKHTKKCA